MTPLAYEIYTQIRIAMKPKFPVVIIALCVLTYHISCDTKKFEQDKTPIHLQLNHKTDTITITPDVYSGYGVLTADSSNIYMMDIKFGTLSVFNHKGVFQERLFGFGKGPQELPYKPHKFDINSSGTVVFINDHTFSFGSLKKDNTVKTVTTDWMENNPLSVLQSKPKGDMNGIYEIDWSKGDNRIAITDSLIYLPIITYHPLLNGYMHKKYYKTTRVVGAFNYNGQLVKTFGKRSNEYLKSKYIANFDKAYITSGNEMVFVSFAIDSLVYAYDLAGKLVTSFGKGHPKLKQNYPEYSSFETAESNYPRNWNEYGTYQSIKYSATDSVLVRLVFPNLNDNTHLQIFKYNEFVGSIETPKNFKLAYVGNGKIIGHTTPDEEFSKSINLITINYTIVNSTY